MKMMTRLIASGIFLASCFAQATPIRLACDGVSKTGRQFKMVMTGTEAVDPNTQKTRFDVLVNVNAATSQGVVIIRDLAYSGTKTISGNLLQYPILAPIQQGKFIRMAIAVNNRDDATASFFDSNYDAEEFAIHCTGFQNRLKR